MCRSKQNGGKRCVSHSPANRRLGRVALRLCGTNDAATREAVSRLYPEYVSASIAERRKMGLAAIDQAMSLARMNQGLEAGDTTDDEQREAWATRREPTRAEFAEGLRENTERIKRRDARLAARTNQEPKSGDTTDAEGLASPKKQDRLDALYTRRDRPIPDALLNDRSYEVRRLVAQSTTEPAQLETLAHDTDVRVRSAVLMNSKTSDNALHTLADLGHADARDSLNKNARRRGEEAPALSAIETARINEASAATARYNAKLDARREARESALAIRRPFLDVARNKTSSAEDLFAAFNNPNADSFAKVFLARHRKSNDTMRLESLHEMGTADKSLLIDWARRATDPALIDALMKHSNKDVQNEAKYRHNKAIS